VKDLVGVLCAPGDLKDRPLPGTQTCPERSRRRDKEKSLNKIAERTNKMQGNISRMSPPGKASSAVGCKYRQGLERPIPAPNCLKCCRNTGLFLTLFRPGSTSALLRSFLNLSFRAEAGLEGRPQSQDDHRKSACLPSCFSPGVGARRSEVGSPFDFSTPASPARFRFG
jgi:hypothetical protein